MSQIPPKSWHQISAELIEILREVISAYYQGDELNSAVRKWETKVCEAALVYQMDLDFLESNAKARISLVHFKGKVEGSIEAFQNLGNTARLGLSKAFPSFGDVGIIGQRLLQIEDAIEDTINEIKKIEKFQQENGLKVTNKRLAPEIFISVLIDAYVDVSGKLPALSYDPVTQKPSGPLFRFIKPIIKIVDEKKTDSGISTIIKDVIDKKKHRVPM